VNESLDPSDTILLYNPTQGFLIDLWECILARDLQKPTFPAILAHEKINNILIKPNITKVVIIAHSQGCIIVSDVLQYLDEDFRNNNNITEEELNKLEIYLFASPADLVTDIDGRIHLEQFANTFDLVSEIGVLCPELQKEAVPNKDLVFTRVRCGHLLCEHYLREEFNQKVYINSKGEKNSRLYDYM